MDNFESEVLKVIDKNMEIIARSMLDAIVNSSDRPMLMNIIWKNLLTVTPPETLYNLLLFYYQRHPEEFLQVVQMLAPKIKETLETYG